MTAPKRIQLRRTAGWRKPDDAIVVGRPTPWGNPIPMLDVGEQYPSLDDEQLHGMVVSLFRDIVMVGGRLELPNWRRFDGTRGPAVFTYPTFDVIRAELAGHDLACWCRPELPCHADVLLELANGSAP